MIRFGAILVFFLLTSSLLLPATPARADCSAPSGIAGQQMYNSSHSVMQYCNGSDWIPMWGTNEKDPVGGGGFEYPAPEACSITSGQMTLINTYSAVNEANSIAIFGDTAFIGGVASSSVRAVNISNPSSPTTISTVSIGTWANNIAINDAGTYAYTVGGGNDGFRVINISNPASMSVVGSLGTAVADNSHGIAVKGNYVYTSSYDDDEIDVINVTTPSSPSAVGSYNNGTYLNGVRDIAISGNYLYALSQLNDRFTVLDISTPTSPTYVASIASSTELDGATGLFVMGNYAYVTAKDDNMVTAVNISNPASPTIAGTLTHANIGAPWYITGGGNYIFVEEGNGDRVVAIDVSNPASMQVVDSVTLAGLESHLELKGDKLYVTSYGNDNMYVIDLGCSPGSNQELSLSDIVEATCPAGYTYNESLASCYRKDTTVTTGVAAEAACVATGGHLAAISGVTENDFVRTLAGADSWIGYNDSAVEGTWQWSNGDPVRYTNWNSGEPNNTSNEDCLQLQVAGTWNDVSCTGTNMPGFICEAAPTFDGITCPAGYKFHPYAMKCMKTSSTLLSWTASKAACEAEDAALVTILSSKKQLAVNAMGGDSNPNIWIGFSKDSYDNQWHWVNGEEAGSNDYTNWGATQPDGSGDYAYTSFGGPVWDDTTNVSKYYMCEKDPEEVCNPQSNNVKTYKGQSSATATLSSYTVPDVKDRILIVGIAEETQSADRSITSVTFAGTPLTLIDSGKANDGTYYDNAALYYLVNPPATTGNIVVTFNGTSSVHIVTANTVNCLAQTAPEAVAKTIKPHTATVTGYTQTTPITTLSDSAFLIDVISGSLNPSTMSTLTPNQHEIASFFHSTAPDNTLGMSSRLTTLAGPYNMSWKLDTNRGGHIVAAFKTNIFESAGDNLGNHSATQNLDMNTFKVTNVGTATAATDGVTKAYVDSVTGSAENDPQVGALTNGKFCRGSGTTQVVCDQNEPGGSPTPVSVSVYVDEKPFGVNGGLPVTGTWTNRTLNKISYDAIGTTLAGDEVTLPAGTYYIDAVMPFKNAGSVATRLVNSGGTVLLEGVNTGFSSGTTNDANLVVFSHVRGVITLGTSTNIRLQYYAQNAVATYGLGQASSPSGPNIYTTLSIQKMD